VAVVVGGGRGVVVDVDGCGGLVRAAVYLEE